MSAGHSGGRSIHQVTSCHGDARRSGRRPRRLGGLTCPASRCKPVHRERSLIVVRGGTALGEGGRPGSVRDVPGRSRPWSCPRGRALPARSHLVCSPAAPIRPQPPPLYRLFRTAAHPSPRSTAMPAGGRPGPAAAESLSLNEESDGPVKTRGAAATHPARPAPGAPGGVRTRPASRERRCGEPRLPLRRAVRRRFPLRSADSDDESGISRSARGPRVRRSPRFRRTTPACAPISRNSPRPMQDTGG
jgi:hypothetical protein